MGAPFRLAFVALVSLAASSAAAALPRLSVGPVRGDAKVAIPAQLASSLCAAFECVLWPEVSTRREPDLAKARKLKVNGILTGAITKDAVGPTVSLSLLTTSPVPAQTWNFPLSATGTLRASDLKQLEQDLKGLVRPATPPAAGSTTRPVKPPVTTPLPPAVVPPVKPAVALPVAPAVTPSVKPTVEPRAPVSVSPEPRPAPPREPSKPATTPSGDVPAASRKPTFVALELGGFMVSRRLSYGGVSTMSGTLQTYNASAVAGPRLRFEAFPAASSPSSALSGAGLFGDYAFSIGLKTVAPSGEKRTTAFSRLAAGATWRSPPLSALGIVLAPRLSYQALKLTVTPTITGLPDANLTGVQVGLGAEAHVTSGVVLLVGAGWVKWLSAKDLIKGSQAFFPGGQAWALEAEAGVGVALWGPLSLRVLGEYTSTKYTLSADPTGTYGASSAEDRQLGARAMLRGEF